MCQTCIIHVFWEKHLIKRLLALESDESEVGTVTSLQVQETRGEVVRVTWVGVQGATAYRVSWRRTDGNLLLVHSYHRTP